MPNSPTIIFLQVPFARQAANGLGGVCSNFLPIIKENLDYE